MPCVIVLRGGFCPWVSRAPPPRDPGRPNAKLSAGFYGIALAAHMCGSVVRIGSHKHKSVSFTSFIRFSPI